MPSNKNKILKNGKEIVPSKYKASLIFRYGSIFRFFGFRQTGIGSPLSQSGLDTKILRYVEQFGDDLLVTKKRGVYSYSRSWLGMVQQAQNSNSKKVKEEGGGGPILGQAGAMWENHFRGFPPSCCFMLIKCSDISNGGCITWPR